MKIISISGKVLHGKRYGRILGFPTANIDRRDFVRQKLKIRLGIYAGRVGKYKAGIVVGPIDNSGNPKIEAHLIGFKGSLYGGKISIELKKFIRPFKKYKDVEDLKKAIKQDIEKVKKLKL